MHRAHHQCHYGVMQIANMLVAAKADDVCILDVSSQCSFTEHMVLATGRSHRHIQAAAAAVAYQVSLANCLTPLGAATSVHVRPSIVHYQLIKCGCKFLGDHMQVAFQIVILSQNSVCTDVFALLRGSSRYPTQRGGGGRFRLVCS